jgi:hypothetical protein
MHLPELALLPPSGVVRHSRVSPYRLSAPRYLRALSRNASRASANRAERSAHSCGSLASWDFRSFASAVPWRLASCKSWNIRSARSMASRVPVAWTAK